MEYDNFEEEQTPQEAFEDLFRPLPSEFQKEPPVLIENTLYKGAIMLIGGAPKIGKSYLAAAMARAFALGKELLGFKFAKCDRVLLVNSEMAAWEYSNRILYACQNPPEAKEVANRVRIAHTDSRPELTIKEIAEVICAYDFSPDVVFIDPIYPVFMGDENNNEHAKKTLGYLKQIASVTGAGVIYLHHFSKGSQDNKEARDRVSGAGTLGRNYSALWSITELAPDEEDMAGQPDGAVAMRIATDLRSFKKSKGNKNIDFNAVRIDSKFMRDEEGKLDSAPTREQARRAKNNPTISARQKNIEKTRKEIEKLFQKTKGEPFLFTEVKTVTARTLDSYLADMDEYEVLNLKPNGQGQPKKHIVRSGWQLPFDGENK